MYIHLLYTDYAFQLDLKPDSALVDEPCVGTLTNRVLERKILVLDNELLVLSLIQQLTNNSRSVMIFRLLLQLFLVSAAKLSFGPWLARCSSM